METAARRFDPEGMEIVQELLYNGADIEQKDGKGRSIEEYAAEAEMIDFIQNLKIKGGSRKHIVFKFGKRSQPPLSRAKSERKKS